MYIDIFLIASLWDTIDAIMMDPNNYFYEMLSPSIMNSLLLYIVVLLITWSWDVYMQMNMIQFIISINCCLLSIINWLVLHILWDTIYSFYNPIYHFHEILYIINNELAGALYIDIFLITLLWDRI